MQKPTDDQIKTRAHQLWELAGRPEGRDDEFWHEAERELSNHSAINSEESAETFTE